MIIKEIKPKETVEKFKQTMSKKSEQRKQVSELINKYKEIKK
jgi:hypothetical protein